MTCVQAGAYSVQTGATEGAIALPPGIEPGNLVIAYVNSRKLFGSHCYPDLPAGWTNLGVLADNPGHRLFCRVIDGSEGSSVPMGYSVSPDWVRWTTVRLEPSPEPLFVEGAVGIGQTIPAATVPDVTPRSVVVVFHGGAQTSGSGQVESREGLCMVANRAGNEFCPGHTTFLDCHPAGSTGELFFEDDSGHSGVYRWGRVIIPSRSGCFTNEPQPLRQRQRDRTRARQLESQQRSIRGGWPNAYL